MIAPRYAGGHCNVTHVDRGALDYFGRMDCRSLLDVGCGVDVVIGTQPSGQGHETSFAQCVSEWLGVPFEKVRHIQGDTDRIPSGHGTGGSASLPIAGAALHYAADDLIRQALPLAADALEAVIFAPRRRRHARTRPS